MDVAKVFFSIVSIGWAVFAHGASNASESSDYWRSDVAAVDVTEETSSSAVQLPRSESSSRSMRADSPAASETRSSYKPAENEGGRERRFNVRYQVPGVLVNSHTLEVDYAISPKITVGPIANYTRQIANSDVSTEYTKKYLGGAVHYFFTGNAWTNGFFLKPYLAFVQVRARVQDSAKSDLTRNESGAVLGLTANYQFITYNGFNLQIGGGLESRNYSDKAEYRKSDGQEQIMLDRTNALPLTGELTLGYAF